MNKSIFVICVFALISSNVMSQEKDFPLLTGQYLGQNPPGMTPEMFAPGIISTDQFEFGGTFSPDGKEFYFTRRQDYQGSENRIYYSRIVNGTWIKPILAPIANNCFEFLPTITPNGDKLIFYSEREKPSNCRFDGNLWYCDKVADGWSKAKYLESQINREFNMMISSTKTGKYYFVGVFNQKRGVFCSDLNSKASSEFESLPDQINSLGPAHPFIATDESYLIFDAQVSGRGNPELFICFRNSDGSWSEPQNMGSEINATKTEFAATVSPDGKFLFFHRRINGNGDIYWVSVKIIDNLKPKEIK